MKLCPNCQSSVRDTAKFCVKCGFNIKKYEEEKEYFCPECGTKFSGGTFCPECGYDISADISEDAPAQSSIPSLGVTAVGEGVDFGALNGMAQDQLYEKEGFVVENGILTGYTGKKRILSIPGTIDEIFDGAFENNEFITYVELQEGIKIIGKRAFANCSSLVKINIPSTVKRIYDDTFEGVDLETLVLTKLEEDMIKPLLSESAKKNFDMSTVEKYTSQEGKGIAVDIKNMDATKLFINKIQRGIEQGNVTLGSYYQSNSEKKDPIEWIVLKKEDKKALLLSKYILDYKPFDAGDKTYTWAGCSLQEWLNGEFFNSAFDADEKKVIAARPDKVLLPSKEDVEGGLPTQDAKRTAPTPQAALKKSDSKGWCTSTGFKNNYPEVYYIDDDGIVSHYWVDHSYGVRPALWIDLDI